MMLTKWFPVRRGFAGGMALGAFFYNQFVPRLSWLPRSGEPRRVLPPRDVRCRDPDNPRRKTGLAESPQHNSEHVAVPFRRSV